MYSIPNYLKIRDSLLIYVTRTHSCNSWIKHTEIFRKHLHDFISSMFIPYLHHLVKDKCFIGITTQIDLSFVNPANMHRHNSVNITIHFFYNDSSDPDNIFRITAYTTWIGSEIKLKDIHTGYGPGDI